MQACPACGQENPDGFRLCGMCGAALSAAAPAAREERKVVTILFTDLVGSTAQAERLDPEDVRKILSPYYSRLRAEIERHGGTVEKFIGDAVMAVFGAPVAHEDDPERAVRAALAIRDALADGELQIRTAVNTGEALVALGARPAEGEGMVSGDVVNTTARLQGAAPVDGILVGEATYRATRDRIEYREAETVVAKGKAAPIPVWEVVGPRGAFGSDVEERLRSPLVGRERERSLLADALSRARSEQSVQLVTLVGVPGIGKSRLVTELFQIVDAEPDLITWRQGRSLPYGESLSFWALGEIVTSQAGILQSDDVETAQAKLEAMLDALVRPDEHAWIAEHVRPLIGLGAEQTERASAFAAWRRLLEAAAEQRPLVLVFEDLHWADDALLDFVDHLADWATTVPLLIVATARPELLDRRPGWGGGKRNAFTLSIGALSDDETTQLLHTLLERAVIDADTQQAILRHADGNPLYAEEYVRMLADHHGGDLPLPESVQGVIAARVDALAPAEKSLLQDASVIGKVFWPGAVGDPDERVLHALERKEFIRRDRRSSVAGETQYAFLHALVQDVAYSQIPRAARAERHRRAAEWIAELGGDRADEQAEMLAHHYRQALALAEAAGVDTTGLRDPAKRAFVEAAQRANALNVWGVARDTALDALALMDESDPQRPYALLTLLDADARFEVYHLDDGVGARDRFLELGDVENAARADILLAWLCFWTTTPGGDDFARHAIELLTPRGPSPLLAAALARHARRRALAGHRDEAIAYAEQALAMAVQFGDEGVASDALNTRGIARADLGDADGCLADLRASIEAAERVNGAHLIGVAWNNYSSCLARFGHLAQAHEALNALRASAERFGYTLGLNWADGEEATLHLVSGRLRAGLAACEAELERLGASGLYQESPIHGARAIALAARGRLAEALDGADRCLELAESVHDPQMLRPALAGHAFVRAAAGQVADAAADLERLLAEPDVFAFPDGTWAAPSLAVELGCESLCRPPETLNPWHQAAAAATRGRLQEAADLYGQIGARFAEAWCRLLAAERGDGAGLDAARAYFAEEDAAVFLRRCDALVQASA